MRIYILFFLFALLSACMSESRLPGIYATSQEDTMRVDGERWFRIELSDPDTVEHKQYKYTSGRWDKRGRNLNLEVDSKSYGPYWQCTPFKIGIRTLSRPAECEGKGKKYIFHKLTMRQIRRHYQRSLKREARQRADAEEEKFRKRMEQLESGNK